MAKIKDIIDIISGLFPPENRMDMGGFEDNVGLLVGTDNGSTNTVLCCLDVTNDVIDEAIEQNARLIVSHHPVIFGGIKSVTNQTPTGSNIIRLISNGISVYSAHTNMDFSFGGINDFAASLLGLKDIKPLDPYIGKNAGFGRVGTLENPMPAADFLPLCKHVFGDDKAALYATKPAKNIKTVAIINGGGGSDTDYIDMAIRQKADCLVTGDIKHHVALYATQKDFCLVEIQHYLCEQIYIPHLAQILKAEADRLKINIDIKPANSERNPRIL